MEEDVLKKTCIFEAPKRPVKSGNVQRLVSEMDAFSKNENSRQIEEITLDDDDDGSVQVKIKCKYCTKDITSWNKQKRETHQLECKKPPKPKKTKLTEVLDKKEEEKFLEESRKVEKKWEISKDSVKFAKIEADEEANRRRKRPRSFAVVELAPRECHCEVLTTLHTRFLEKFAVSSQKHVDTTSQNVTEFAICQKKILKKMNRLEQLSNDFRKMIDDEKNDARMIGLRGFDGVVQCARPILKHRTTILTKNTSLSTSEICLDFPRKIIQLWLIFVQSAQIEWSRDEAGMIRQLGETYGPVGMVEWIDQMSWQPELEKKKNDTPQQIEEPNVFETDDPLIGFDFEEHREEPMQVVIEPVKETNFEKSGNFERENQDDGVEKEIEEVDAPNLDIFDTDDPLIGFDFEEIQEPIFRKPGGADSPQKINQSMVDDSFENFIPSGVRLNIDKNEEKEQEPEPEASCSNVFLTKTPENRQSFEKLSFASNIRILKTTNITPMPDFELMTEEELKNQMKEIGQRPKGRKKMIEMLRMAYDTLHPAVMTDTPTIRPIAVAEVRAENCAAAKPKKSTIKPLHLRLVAEERKAEENDAEEDDDLADRTLNMSDEFEMVGKLIGDTIDAEEEEEEEQFDRKDLGSMKTAFLQWIRQPPNYELYTHMLSLNPVSLEELLARLAKSSGPESLIGKAKLSKILDELSITYQLPQKPGNHRKGARRYK